MRAAISTDISPIPEFRDITRACPKDPAMASRKKAKRATFFIEPGVAKQARVTLLAASSGFYPILDLVSKLHREPGGPRLLEIVPVKLSRREAEDRNRPTSSLEPAMPVLVLDGTER
jgi:hypothetical protein